MPSRAFKSDRAISACFAGELKVIRSCSRLAVIAEGHRASLAHDRHTDLHEQHPGCLADRADPGYSYPLALPRIPAGVFVAFFVPGYAALLALNGASRVGKFTLIQHLVLSIPLSFSFAVIVGVLLNDTPLGVRPLSSRTM